MKRRKRTGRYNSKKVTYDGQEFDSMTERDFYKHLVKLKEEGSIKDFTKHKTYQLVDDFTVTCRRCRGDKRLLNSNTGNLNQCSLCKGKGVRKRQGTTYTPDFIIHHNDGKDEFIDVKGAPNTSTFNLKKKLFEQRYNHEVVIVRKKKGEFRYDR